MKSKAYKAEDFEDNYPEPIRHESTPKRLKNYQEQPVEEIAKEAFRKIKDSPATSLNQKKQGQRVQEVKARKGLSK
ncbi:hypothetical protein JTB14_028809 [Gonioctena quinquepunctata]|nr:hypothetical protein JTB14_028809 [Gonioctena quinquepunctata]